MISILIPAYNAEKFIQAAIESALLQRGYTDCEILVCDDGSTDSTVHMVQKIASKHHGIKLFHLEKNAGVSAARNRLLSEINPSSDWVSFLDADDVLVQDAYQPAMKILKMQPELQMVFCKMHMVPTEFLVSGGVVSDDWPIMGGITLSTGLFKREMIMSNGLFDHTLTHGEDLDFLMRMAERTNQFTHLDHVMFYYRRHQHNATLNAKSLQSGVMRAILLHTIRRKKNPNLLAVHGLFKDEAAETIVKVRKFHEKH